MPSLLRRRGCVPGGMLRGVCDLPGAYSPKKRAPCSSVPKAGGESSLLLLGTSSGPRRSRGGRTPAVAAALPTGSDAGVNHPPVPEERGDGAHFPGHPRWVLGGAGKH